MRKRCNERGETLLEIVIALVVIGIVVSAFFAAYSTAAVTSSTHRNIAQADAILRGAAEATKSAVRDQCVRVTPPPPAPATASVSNPGATYVTTTTSLPSGFSLSATSSPSGQTCPPVSGLQQVTFSLAAPGAAPRTLTIQVRTP